MTSTYQNLEVFIDQQQNIAHLVFDRPDSSANIFDQQTLEETLEVCQALAAMRSLKGLIISSAKPNIFIAGADLHTLSQLEGDEMTHILKLGQKMADAIAHLPFPKVAAINGACVGGGLELALACDWRITSDSSAVKLGLPETKLGILPGWGGSTRLPRLIGLPNALPLILTGKLLNAKSALRKDLTDDVVPKEHLLNHAKNYLQHGFRTMPTFPTLHNPLSVNFIKKQAKKSLLSKTRGLYPAPLVALEVACSGVLASHEESLANERREFLKLSSDPVAKNLIKLFFLGEAAKKAKVADINPKSLEPITDAAVIGAGVMGAGIAYWLTTRGYPTLLKDLNPDALASGVHHVRNLYRSAQKKRVFTAEKAQHGRDLLSATTADVPLAKDLIIEAAVENLEIKKKIFATLAERARPDTILATNTSALPITEIALSTPNPERVIGIHFFNPVPRMPLVEIVRTEVTSEDTLARTLQFVQKIGKTPIVVKDSPGFLVNRVLVPYLIEAAVLFIKGEDPEQIDRAMLDFGMPMGPLRLLDEVGLDVGMHVAQTLAEAFPDRMHVPTMLQGMIDSGDLGKKAGKGFYLYEKGKSTTINPAALQYQTDSIQIGSRSTIAKHLNNLMKDETERCVNEGIVQSKDDANLAMILGTGYAPFSGGPLD